MTLQNDTQDRIINRALFVGRRMVRAAGRGDMAAMVAIEEKVTDVLCDAVAFDHHLADTRSVETNTHLPETETLVARILTHYKRKADEAAAALRAEQDRMPLTKSVTLTAGEWARAAQTLQHALGHVLNGPNMANEGDRVLVALMQGLGIAPVSVALP